MSFSRRVDPDHPAGRNLDRALRGIGIRLATSPPESPPNIEESLLAGVTEALMKPDLRLLSLLSTWFQVHSRLVNTDALYRLVKEAKEPLIRGYFAAVGKSNRKDSRWKRFVTLHRGPRLDLPEVETDFHLSRFGEDKRFEGGPLRVPANVLRDRPRDIMKPADLARQHRDYHYRLLIGPTYRADLWSALEREPNARPSELARKTFSSFGTAWNAKRDFVIVHGQGGRG